MKLGDVFLRLLCKMFILHFGVRYQLGSMVDPEWEVGLTRLPALIVGELGCPEAFSTEIKHSELFPTLIMRPGPYIIAMWSISLDVFHPRLCHRESLPTANPGTLPTSAFTLKNKIPRKKKPPTPLTTFQPPSTPLFPSGAIRSNTTHPAVDP